MAWHAGERRGEKPAAFGELARREICFGAVQQIRYCMLLRLNYKSIYELKHLKMERHVLQNIHDGSR